MAAAGGGSFHASDDRWDGGDNGGRRRGDGRRRHREHRRHRDDRTRFNSYQFLQMGTGPLFGGESPKVAEDWLATMENCFKAWSRQCEEVVAFHLCRG